MKENEKAERRADMAANETAAGTELGGETFKMTYSADSREEIENIRSKYLPRRESRIERLRAIEAAVNKKATVASITIGIIGTLIMGMGMSLVMSDLGALFGALSLPIGIAAGVLGIVILAMAYPVYTLTLKRARKKAAPEVLRLTDELMR